MRRVVALMGWVPSETGGRAQTSGRRAPRPLPIAPSMPRGQVSERALLAVIGAVQFINILDFMMVAPLGPDFARALGIPLSHIGYVFGSYTAAAALAGVAGPLFFPRFVRKPAV